MSFELTPEEKIIIDKIGSERFLRNGEANLIYQRLLHSYSLKDTLGNYEYPDYYGGAYINTDNNLTINVTEEVEECRDDLIVRIDDTDVKYRVVDVSYKVLDKIMNDLRDYLVENRDDEYAGNVISFALDEEKNHVIMNLKSMDEKYIIRYKEIINSSDHIEFQLDRDGYVTDEIDLTAGYPLSNSTLGYRARYNGSEGVIVSGHAVAVGGTIKTTGGSSIGLCLKRMFHAGATCDASWCTIINSSYTPSNKIEGFSTASLSTTTLDPVQNSIVFKVGKKTGLTSGTVTRTNVGVDNGVFITHKQVEATYNSDGGDSGGIVYAVTGSTRFTCGIHKGANSTHAYFSKATIITSDMGCSRY